MASPHFAAQIDASLFTGTPDFPFYLPAVSFDGSRVEIAGRTLLGFASNDYLGLARHPGVIGAAQQALAKFGASTNGSRVLNGSTTLHEALERSLADWLGSEDCVLFPTGYQACMGVVATVGARASAVVLDREAHASLFDGARQSGARVCRFEHNDVLALRRRLKALDRGALVVVDSVYSMSGDVAPLAEIHACCSEFGATLLIDEAHGLGVLGQGHGGAYAAGVTGTDTLVVGTFSKALGSIGGFAVGSSQFALELRSKCRSQLFSAALSPASTAAALEALNILRAEPARVARASARAATIRAALREDGLPLSNCASTIVPVVLSDAARVLHAWQHCFDSGVYVNAVLAPAAPAGRALLRVSCTADHRESDCQQLIDVLRGALRLGGAGEAR